MPRAINDWTHARYRPVTVDRYSDWPSGRGTSPVAYMPSDRARANACIGGRKFDSYDDCAVDCIRRNARARQHEYRVVWSPTAQEVARVFARTARAAIRKAPKPYRRYLGEIYAERIT